jgi:anti-sigma factor RsiW
LNCTEFLAKLTDYFDGQIDASLLDEVKQHLGSCHHCEVLVSTTKQTIAVYRGEESYELPDDLATRLRSAVMNRCRSYAATGVAKGEAAPARPVDASAS